MAEDNTENKDSVNAEPQSVSQDQSQQSVVERNPFMKTVAELIHRGRNRRTFAKPR